MPMPVAHGLLGASIVAAIYPKPTNHFYLPLLVGGFLANAADFDFLFVFIFGSKAWHRGFSHSITLALIVYLIFILYYGKYKFRKATSYGLAFASHFILDFLTTKEGGGVELLSPFSTERFVFGWRGLSEMPSKLSIIQIIQALGIEFLIFGLVLLFILFLRSRFAKQNTLTVNAM